MTTRADVVRRGRDSVMNTTLIELLVQLIFVAMAFALVLRSEDERALSDQARDLTRAEQQIADMRAELEAARTELAEVRERNTALEEMQRLILGQRGPETLPSNPAILAIPQSEYARMRAENQSLRAVIESQQRDAGDMAARIGALQGSTFLPICAVTERYLLHIALLPDGSFSASPAWHPGAQRTIDAIPGLTSLADGSVRSSTAFSALASQAADWGRAQSVPCTFRVRLERRHTDADVYDQQLNEVARHFYSQRTRAPLPQN